LKRAGGVAVCHSSVEEFQGFFSVFFFSLMSYKTNWMIPFMIFPLVLHVGNTVDHIIKRFRFRKTIVFIVFLLILNSLFLSIQQNHLLYNDFKRNKIGYVESSPEINKLVYDIKEYAKGEELKIMITAHGYWPLPAYLREYELMYFTQIEKLNESEYTDYGVFISDSNQVSEIRESFTRKEYEIRNNYHIVVLFRD